MVIRRGENQEALNHFSIWRTPIIIKTSGFVYFGFSYAAFDTVDIPFHLYLFLSEFLLSDV